MILSSHGLIASQIASFDADAVAFFGRVTTAGGSLSATEKTAVDTLVRQMKLDGTWTPMKAIYPMVGASAAACAQNLKSSSFTGSFTSGWTFASTGVTGNGTSAYMNTNFNTATNQTVNNCSLSAYLRTSTMASGTDIGNFQGASALPLTLIQTSSTTRNFYCWDYQTSTVVITTSNPSGMWGVSRSGASAWVSFARNAATARTTPTTQTTLPNNNVYIGASNSNGTADEFTTREIAFAHLGDSLSSTQFNNLYTTVQAFQTTLSRQV